MALGEALRSVDSGNIRKLAVCFKKKLNKMLTAVILITSIFKKKSCYARSCFQYIKLINNVHYSRQIMQVLFLSSLSR